MAKGLGGTYTRYADDLTLSFDRSVHQLSSLIIIDDENQVALGGALSSIILSEGFNVNHGKLHLSQGTSKKIVTGLVVNEKVNTKRSWYKTLESQIYAIEKFGIDAIASAQYPHEESDDTAKWRLLRNVHGKISYFRMIRGHGDWMAADLAYRFNKLHEQQFLRVPSVELISRRERLNRSVLIVNCAPSELHFFHAGENQGTAFVSTRGLLVTAAHVISTEEQDVLEYVYVFNEKRLKLIRCEVLAVNHASDVAFLKPVSAQIEIERHRLRAGQDPTYGDSLTAIGYPNYELGNQASLQLCSFVRPMRDGAVNKAEIAGAIHGGMSGGPVVGTDLRVRGMIHKGMATMGGAPQVVCISEVIKVARDAGLVF